MYDKESSLSKKPGSTTDIQYTWIFHRRDFAKCLFQIPDEILAAGVLYAEIFLFRFNCHDCGSQSGFREYKQYGQVRIASDLFKLNSHKLKTVFPWFKYYSFPSSPAIAEHECFIITCNIQCHCSVLSEGQC